LPLDVVPYNLEDGIADAQNIHAVAFAREVFIRRSPYGLVVLWVAY